MKHRWVLIWVGLLTVSSLAAQNRSWLYNVSLGFGHSGFQIEEQGEDEIKGINYLAGGFQIQKRINDQWALNVYPNVGMSGSRRILSNPLGRITELRSVSALINLAVHPKYYFHKSFYLSAGPEVSYLLWNYGRTYDEQGRLSSTEETRFFNRVNLLASSSLGISRKVGTSRKNAPIQVDALWQLEFRIKKGLTNILNRDFFGDGQRSSILSFEVVTGISFATKQ